MECAPKQSVVSESCQAYNNDPLTDKYRLKTDLTPIAALPWRAVGTSLIIYTGAFSLTVGYLLALFAIRFGVEIPEDKNFAPLNDPSTAQNKVSFAQDPQLAPAPRQTVPG